MTAADTAADPARAIVQLKRAGGGSVGPQRLVLLAAIADHGSIAGAARAVGLSYKGAWEAVQALNNLFDHALVDARQGGAATVTAAGRLVLEAYGAIEQELDGVLEKLDRAVASAGLGSDIVWRMRMRTSARNMLRGKVLTVTDGAVNAEVILDIGNGLTVTAIVTRESVAELNLAPGREALALIKASFVDPRRRRRKGQFFGAQSLCRHGDRPSARGGQRRGRAGHRRRQDDRRHRHP